MGGVRKEKQRAHLLREIRGTGAPEAREAAGTGLPGGGVAYEGILAFPFFRDLRLVLDYYHGVLLIES